MKIISYKIEFRDGAPSESVGAADLLAARIDELSGRTIGSYIVRVPLRRKGRAFVASAQGRSSFLVTTNKR